MPIPSSELLETLRHSDEYLTTLLEQLRRELIARQRIILDENGELRRQIAQLEHETRELRAALEQLTAEVQPGLFDAEQLTGERVVWAFEP